MAIGPVRQVLPGIARLLKLGVSEARVSISRTTSISNDPLRGAFKGGGVCKGVGRLIEGARANAARDAVGDSAFVASNDRDSRSVCDRE
jgi:hypothetical protein